MSIVNLTPHAITIPVTLRPDQGPWTLAPSGTIARAAELATANDPIGDIPTVRVRFGAVEGLPDPQWIALPNPCDAPGAVDHGQCLACGAIDCHVPGVPRAPAVRRNLIERTRLGWRITDHGRKTLREHKAKHA